MVEIDPGKLQSLFSGETNPPVFFLEACVEIYGIALSSNTSEGVSPAELILGSSEAGMVLQSCPKFDVTTGATRINASPWGEGNDLEWVVCLGEIKTRSER